MPLYHPSLTIGQVVPNLSVRGRDLLQVCVKCFIIYLLSVIPISAHVLIPRI